MTKVPTQAERSKYLSYLLRHKPEAANLVVDKEGWVNISHLCFHTDFTLMELKEIVRTDNKGRYSFSEDDMSIRANQGHSTDKVRLTFNKAVPPTVLYHGTNDKILSSIMKEGLKPMNRHHVHLSSDLTTAQTVGGRRKGGLVVLKVDAKQMLADGYAFFLSDNGVWLVDAVPAKYLSEHKD